MQHKAVVSLGFRSSWCDTGMIRLGSDRCCHPDSAARPPTRPELSAGASEDPGPCWERDPNLAPTTATITGADLIELLLGKKKLGKTKGKGTAADDLVGYVCWKASKSVSLDQSRHGTVQTPEEGSHDATDSVGHMEMSAGQAGDIGRPGRQHLRHDVRRGANVSELAGVERRRYSGDVLRQSDASFVRIAQHLGGMWSSSPWGWLWALIKGVASACISAIFPFPMEIFECEMSLPSMLCKQRGKRIGAAAYTFFGKESKFFLANGNGAKMCLVRAIFTRLKPPAKPRLSEPAQLAELNRHPH
ncbi:hypothetical protein EYF80_001549 [Liparis tanakae]|uniref:Uncharacterized protein n=1 Tax=Liparis tanakae TaxID=230148 RepID=A0A4Z2JEX8_9TELE|nr:hypothetical protein EYF80_001549 [Liparis tanakae]